MSRRRFAGFFLAALCFAIILGACSSGGSGGGMMGGGMMGGGMMGGGMMGGGMMGGSMMASMNKGVRSSSPIAARRLARRSLAGAGLSKSTDRLIYRGPAPQIVALAAPEGGPDMTWNIGGLVNPTVVVPAAARVTLTFFDADVDHPHGFEITAVPPPYPYMAMMYAGTSIRGGFAMPVTAATKHTWLGRTIHFVASRPGTYYYLCPVMGHAQHGMYGRFVVRGSA